MEVPTKIGRYRVLESLGQGASGFVLKVEQEIIRRIVAMKILFAQYIHSKPLVIRRFKREARLACSLVHPNIVPIFEIDEANGMYYYTMQYIEGFPMTKVVQNKQLNVKQKLDICVGLCDALALAHNRNIIHRDLKPHNVIITKDLNPVILDFGIAKSLIEEEHMTQSGHILGSAHYMAPEQAGPGNVGTHTDVFGLGVMMYELMTTQRPFQGGNVTQLIYDRIQYGQNPEANRPPSMKIYNSDLPEALNKIIFRSIEGKPEKRYPSAKELLVDLRNLQDELSFAHMIRTTDSQYYQSLLPVNKKKSYWYPAISAAVIIIAFFLIGIVAKKDFKQMSWLTNFQERGAKFVQKYVK